jgi:hypothetical protein
MSGRRNDLTECHQQLNSYHEETLVKILYYVWSVPNIMVHWLVLMFCIWRVVDMYSSMETIHPDWGCSFWHVYVLPPGYSVWPCSPHVHHTEFVTSHNEQKESFQQYFYNRYKMVVYAGLRSDSIKNHASHNEARCLTCICLTAIWRHVLLAPSYLRLLGGECVSVDVESCCSISNLRFNLYCLAYSAFFCFLTCDMYKSSLRHIHDPVLSSLKMKGIRLLFFSSWV